MGFGLKDSVSYIGEGQFEEVFAYDGSIIFDADAEEVEQEELAETVAADERITDSAGCWRRPWTWKRTAS